MAGSLNLEHRANVAESLADNISELVVELERQIGTFGRDRCVAILGHLEQLKALAYSRIMIPAIGAVKTQTEPFHDRYLTVLEVCERFHVTRKWVYQNKHLLPHSQPTRKTLRFPERAIEQYFASKNKCEEL